MTNRWIKAALFPLASLVLGACVTTNHTTYQETADPVAPLDRQVVYHLDRAFHADLPACVVVMPSTGAIDSQIAKIIEDSITRHLTMKVSKVIGPTRRRRLERELAIDLSSNEGQQRFGQITNCRGVLHWRTLEATESYALVIASQSFGLELEMADVTSHSRLWRASHVTQRWDGGVPLSPLSVAFLAFEATQFHSDTDIMPSMVDDVVRRLFVTLPDLR